ncbi:MAG: hypothetical protein QOG68_970 [Solirubrobacteraceae bacterium]|jgi:hypothetical protein|nr:hypothetical protein [Solirubrobacteraceae bacterium]
MRKPLSIMIAATALGLALAPAAAFADSATEDLLLARDACGGTGAANTRLALSAGTATGGCGSALGGASPSTTTYPATEGVPVLVDDSRPVVVDIDLTSYHGVAVGGIGDETVSVELTGTRDKKSVTLGTGSSTIAAADMLRTPHYTAEFSMPLGAAKAGTYTALSLDVTVGGAFFSGYVDHGGKSFVSVPVFDPPADPGSGG